MLPNMLCLLPLFSSFPSLVAAQAGALFAEPRVPRLGARLNCLADSRARLDGAEVPFGSAAGAARRALAWKHWQTPTERFRLFASHYLHHNRHLGIVFNHQIDLFRLVPFVKSQTPKTHTTLPRPSPDRLRCPST